MKKTHFIALITIVLLINGCAVGRKIAPPDPVDEMPSESHALGDVVIKNDNLYKFISQWQETPYRFGGLSKAGIDCSGFVYLLMRDVYGKEVPRNTSELATTALSINILQEGDLVFFDINRKKHSHVGVYIKNNKFVHAGSKTGVTISCLTNPYFSKYLSRKGRIP